MSEDQYAQVSWQEELNAERFAWRCYADELKLSPSDRDRLVQLRSQQFAGANQAAYDAEFRATHQGARRRQPQQPAPRTVAFGKCLSLITRDLWNDVFLWPVLYDANRAAIGPDPNVVKPGLALAVPDLNQFSPSQLADAQRRGRAWKPSR
jgi:hypothetical protein